MARSPVLTGWRGKAELHTGSEFLTSLYFPSVGRLTWWEFGADWGSQLRGFGVAAGKKGKSVSTTTFDFGFRNCRDAKEWKPSWLPRKRAGRHRTWRWCAYTTTMTPSLEKKMMQLNVSECFFRARSFPPTEHLVGYLADNAERLKKKKTIKL